MLTFSRMKWVFFIVMYLPTVSFVEGKHISRDIDKKKGSEDVSENSSNLYFNGGEQENPDDPFADITKKDLPQNGELFEGDMVMDSGLRRAILGEEDRKAAVVNSELGGQRHWSDGHVPYYIDDTSIHPSVAEQIPKAVKIFNYFTCVKFRPRTELDIDFVVFMNGRGCSSSVGRKGGRQNIHLAKGCKRIGTVMHEMMHALGIIHEQSRPDRDRYLEVRFKNIKKDLLRNFMKYKFYQADTLGTDYNYYSVMHYSNYAFSKNDEETLVAKFDTDLKFGQRKMLTHLDVKQINTLYPCEKHPERQDLLYDDMTPNIIVKRRRDARKDEWREMLDEYFKRIA